MKVGTFFVRTWRVLSIFGFLFSLFNSYISYPNEVAVRFDSIGYAIQYIDREVLFYLAIGIFLLNNTLVNLVSRLFVRLPSAQVPVPNQAVWIHHRDQLNENVTNWFTALMAAVNTILALGLMVLSFLNRSDRSQMAMDYAWLLPLSTVILVTVLVALPIRLFVKPTADD
ncbi:hypothetical protein [Spirosoma montaniterrae]|uniref:DUF1648 domain-containing protein n=1 Tax=Spirosoma montaniterrae TaxID=1178516 RepID=A0A1P9WXT4_9BACT|nr:hypothetical protein [Spirosoma montaniterrae]AQG80185.1 hypothetical protein AWR27_13175 [Spirosoma montaniterrae]